MSKIVLAATYHDAEGRLLAQMARVLPRLRELYGELVVLATATTRSEGLELLRQHGVLVAQEDQGLPSGMQHVGRSRRTVLDMVLQPDGPYIHLCDFDRVLHWAECYPDELKAVLVQMQDHDFTVLGRTPRAFDSHPQVQRDTEAIINTVFARASGDEWDVTAASRGISQRAAALLVHSDDDSVGNDCSWPLLLRHKGGLRMGFLATEGLEFETADRYIDAVAAAGGLEAWKTQIDSDPRAWEQRLEVARLEVMAMVQKGSDG